MKRKMDRQSLESALARVSERASIGNDAARDHVRQNLRSRSAFADAVTPSSLDVRPASLWTLRQPYLAFAGIIAVVVLSIVGLRSGATGAAVVQSADGSVYRVAAGESRPVAVGETIEPGDTVRAEASAVLALTDRMLSLGDGSNVEMRMQSELSLERAEDGLRIRLNKGSIIVNAAKQGHGHLYVQTKDMIVSVIGTVFLVNAETDGSRVAVIQGEVHVQQGARTKKLLPGEQVASNPSMPSHSVSEEVSWSRNATAHVALLEQTSPATLNPKPTSPEANDKFDVVSIRPTAPGPVGGGGRGGPGGRGGGAPGGGLATTCTVSRPVVARGDIFLLDPGRFLITNANLFRLITLAYAKDCLWFAELDLLSGPEWIKTERFDIQATIPAGSPVYTYKQAIDGDAPKLQSMIQNMLADRFKLALHREVKEMPIYNLVVARQGQLKLSADQSEPPPLTPAELAVVGPPLAPTGPPTFSDANGGRYWVSRGGFQFLVNAEQGRVTLVANAVPISQIVNLFKGHMGRLIIDKTDLKGLYDVPPLTVNVGPFEIGGVSVWPQIAAGLLPQLGLKLEPARGPVETLVIDHAEKPSEN